MPSYDVKISKVSDSQTSIDSRGFIVVTSDVEYTIVIDVGTDSDIADSVRRACQGQGLLPRAGDRLASSLSQYCNGVSCSRKSALTYVAKATYTSSPRPMDQTDEDLAPWEQPASIDFDTISSEVETDVDADGDPLVNEFTGEAIRGIKRPIDDLGATIVKSFINFDPKAIKAFQNKVNNDVFLGFDIGTVRVTKIRASSRFYNGIEYFEVTVNIVIREEYQTTAAEAWFLRRVFKGFYVVSSSGQVVLAVDGTKTPVKSPVLLAADGTRLPVGGTPHFVSTRQFESATLGDMGLF